MVQTNQKTEPLVASYIWLFPLVDCKWSYMYSGTSSTDSRVRFAGEVTAYFEWETSHQKRLCSLFSMFIYIHIL